MVTLQLRQIRVLAGQRVVLEDVSWQEFEAILEELGDRRNTRLAYSKGTLEIMAPLLEHEVSKEIIGDLVKSCSKSWISIESVLALRLTNAKICSMGSSLTIASTFKTMQ